MSKPRKNLCDWSKKELRERFAELTQIVAEPRFVCVKCGRAAACKAILCKPKTLLTASG
ncbi:hypothetical protein [Botrimarina hoheduenensis]|uniref:Uncharacterized protein n=1 Tax=Botrimarina hoheduenensis TaxID=2528000 RepID=A0A5C5VXP2_9BACT|nr:hypothetical protein [Botrimarina hoheduenensis]TWT42765.1 hypothetical protein Pla111_27380 [Botrimarina hoheduenensis]